MTQPRTLLNRAILRIVRRIRKRGQIVRPLFVGNFQGETPTNIPANVGIEGQLRESDLRNWFGEQIANMVDWSGPAPVMAAKNVMTDLVAGTGNVANSAPNFKDDQFLNLEDNADELFRFILLGATGNWMGRAIHWPASFVRLYGMIIGDRVRRAYFENTKAGATKIVSAVVGTGGNAGKIVLTVNRRLVVDAGGRPQMPGLYKSDGLNGTGFLTYGLIFVPDASSPSRTINGDVTLTLGTHTTTILVPISGTGPMAGDEIRVTGPGVLYSNFREETERVGYYPTQAFGALPLADSTPDVDLTADAVLSDYLAPGRFVVSA